jgi:TetR/AcrR family tetracycline transcriptional repressor
MAGGRAAPLDREAVIDAALRLVEDEGATGLSMRRLAAELGVAVTAIYWHVGGRDVLVAELVDRIVADIGRIRARGATPQERVASIARSLRKTLRARPHLVGLADQMGRTAAMFQPAQAGLARELVAAGLHGRDAALAVQAIQFHVVGSVVLERTASRAASEGRTNPDVWQDAEGVEPMVARRLARPADHDGVFEFGLRHLIDSVLSDAAGS